MQDNYEELIRESQQLHMVKKLVEKRMSQYSGLKYEELEILSIMLRSEEPEATGDKE